MKNAKRNVIVSSFMAIALCMSVVAGATFALFTSDSSVNIAITSGNVEVTATASALKVYSPKAVNETGIADADNAVNENGGRFVNGGTATLTGSELKLDNMTPGDKVNFNIKVENKSSVTVKYRTRIYCGEDNGLYAGLKYSITNGTETYESMAITDWATLTPDVREAADLACEVELPVETGNEYKNKSCKLVYQVEAVQGNAETANDTRYYTLAQFNALTEIPAEVKNVYLNIGAVSLKNGSVVIGNDNIRDKYLRNSTAEEPYGVSYTDKDGINLVIDGGTIKDGPAVDHAVENKIAFRIPNKSIVTFKNVKIEGFFGLSGATSDNPYGSVMTHKIAGVSFENCTFDALWFQDGSFGTKQIALKNCTFNKHENSVYASNTNPMWFKNIGEEGGMGISIDSCVFNTNRPVKVVEQTVKGQSVSITNCTFNMESDAENKNAAIMFSTTTTGSTLGNVVVSGNKVNGGVALLTFYKPSQITMAEGATFVVSGNTLASGVKLSVVWKSATEYLPTFVEAA